MKTAALVADAASPLAGLTLDTSTLNAPELLDALSALRTARNDVDRLTAQLSGEIALRSRRSLGYAGLAQAAGYRTAEALVQSAAGVDRRDASRLVQIGALLAHEHNPHAFVEHPEFAWQQPLAEAVRSRTISVDAADAIRRGLGNADLPHEHLHDAVARLVATSEHLDVESLYRRARDEHDHLDEAAIARREKEQRDLRFLRARRRDDGMVAGSFLLDAEDGTLFLSALESSFAPRRPTPSFNAGAPIPWASQPKVSTRGTELAQLPSSLSLAPDDDRTLQQVAADALLAMVRLAVDADPGRVFANRRPAVRVIVTEQSIRNRSHGYLEDTQASTSFGSVERLLCDTGSLALRFDDDGHVLNLGRSQRLFSERQKVALSVRDGGCRFTGCQRPPSQCEAHHINQWQRDEGRTDLADGILLCRHHHLLVHNNGWRVKRDGRDYSLVPPPDVDLERTPRPLPSRSAAVLTMTRPAARAT